MADDLLRELLTSPLDEPVKRRRRQQTEDAEIAAAGAGEVGVERPSRPALGTTPVVIALGALLGAAIVFVGYAIGDEAPSPTTAAPTTTTTTVAPALGAPGGLPDDYTAIGDRLGMRVERILVRSDGVFVTVTTVVENSLDPDESAGYQGGVWTLVLADDRRIASTSEAFDPLARGTVSVRFPPDGVVAEDIVGLEVNGVANRLTTVVETPVATADPLPSDGSPIALSADAAVFGIDADVDLVIDSLELSTEEGLMSWSLGGGATAHAAVEPMLTLDDPDGTTVEMSTRVQTSGFTFFHPSVATVPLATSGAHAFDPPSPDALAPGPWTGTLALQITWATYDPVVVSLPVEDVPVAVVTG